MSRPKVAILTSLTDFSSGFSLCGVILDQARMLHRAGYDYDLLVLRPFNESHKKRAFVDGQPLRVRYDLAQCVLHDYQPNEPPRPEFDQQVEQFFSGNEHGMGYRDALDPYDTIITHDLMFLAWHLPQNAAIRRCVEVWPKKRWLHWVHSGPSFPQQKCYPSTLRYRGCDRSTYVYLNARQRQDVANMFGIQPQQVACVYNARDVRDIYSFQPETCRLIDGARLLDHQVLQVYPFSTPRWRAKGVRHLLRTFGCLKRQGVQAKLVLVNAHCTQDRDVADVMAMEDMARKMGLTPGTDVIWTSRFAADQLTENRMEFLDWGHGVPQQVVRELQLCANLFVFPTYTECCSLIQAESAISRQVLVLNRDVPQLLEFGSPNVLHFEFTRNDPERNEEHYVHVARELWAFLQGDPTFMTSTLARTRWYNRDWIWQQQLEPLLHRGHEPSYSTGGA